MMQPSKHTLAATLKMLLGPLLVVAVVVLWAVEINLMQEVKTWDPCLLSPPPPPTSVSPTACPWVGPFFVGISLKCIFVAALPITLLVRWAQRRRSGEEMLLGSHAEDESRSRPLSLDCRIFGLSGALCLLVLGASFTWCASVPITSAAVNTALYQLSTPMVYLFSIPLLGEGLSVSKAAGVVFAFGGVLCVIFSKGAGDGESGGESGSAEQLSLSTRGERSRNDSLLWGAKVGGGDDSSGGRAALRGNLLVLMSAALYGLKEVAYKRFFSRHSPTPLTDSGLCVGLLGVWACVCGPVLLFGIDISNIEAFTRPPAPMMCV